MAVSIVSSNSRTATKQTQSINYISSKPFSRSCKRYAFMNNSSITLNWALATEELLHFRFFYFVKNLTYSLYVIRFHNTTIESKPETRKLYFQ